MVKLTRHKDQLNMRAAFLLNNVTNEGGKQVLIDLFRSSVEIDRQTREAIADALERNEGIRLELVQAAGRPAFYTDRLSTWHEYQEIADEVMALQHTLAAERGYTPKKWRKEAMHLVQERRGIGEAKVKKALAYKRRASMTIAFEPLEVRDS